MEDLVFRVVLEVKAEAMAVRDILIEKELVSAERWDELVERHRTSFDAFEVVSKIERTSDPGSASGSQPHESEGEERPGQGSDSPGDTSHEG